MCGIFGFARCGNTNIKEADKNTARNIFNKLAILNMERGTHSTGVAKISTNGAVSIYKNAVSAIHLVFKSRWNSCASIDGNHKIVLGHTRFATHGLVNKENAHPFKIDNIVGTHNGVISYFGKFNGESNYEVDSQNFFHLLNSNSPSDVINEISGSATTAYVNTTEPNILRFTKYNNPLSIFVDERTNIVYWSSEENHLIEAISSTISKKKLKKLDIFGKTCVIYLDIISGKFSIEELSIENTYRGYNYYFPNSGKCSGHSNHGEYTFPDTDGYGISSNYGRYNSGPCYPHRLIEEEKENSEINVINTSLDCTKNNNGDNNNSSDDENAFIIGKYVKILDIDRAKIKIRDGHWAKVRPANTTNVILLPSDVQKYQEFITRNFHAAAIRELADIFCPDEGLLDDLDIHDIVEFDNVPYKQLSDDEKEEYDNIKSHIFMCGSCYGEFAPTVKKYVVKSISSSQQRQIKIANDFSLTRFRYGLIICPICNLYTHINRSKLISTT